MIKLLIAEDSPVVRELLVNIFQKDPEISIVGVAKDGLEAVSMAGSLHPDVITMDIQMPKMNGVEATRLIMEECPTRIIVVSASVDKDVSRPAFEAMKAGALAVVDKPRGFNHKDFNEIRDSLIKTVKIMSNVKVITRWRSKTRGAAGSKQKATTKIIAIGASTGGPAALSLILKGLPADLSIPVLIVQHMTPGFGPAFASWLHGESPIPVKTAEIGEKLEAGQVFVAPDNFHLGLTRAGQVALTTEKLSYNSHRPSINYMFDTVAKNFGNKALGVLLTGMGEDGALGLREIKLAGGKTIAQDEQSCIVFGMPKSAIALGAVDQIVPLDKIASVILAML